MRPTVILLALALCVSCASPGNDGYFRHVPVSQLQAYLDTAPVPLGATLAQETATPGLADRGTTVERVYVTTGAAPACTQLVQVVAYTTGWTFTDSDVPVDPRTCVTVELPMGELRQIASATGEVGVTWQPQRLYYTASEGNTP